MVYVVDGVRNLIYMLSFICVGQLFFGFKRQYRKYEKIVLLVTVLITTILWIYLDIWAQVIIHCFSIWVILFVYFKEKKSILFVFYFVVASVLSMLNIMFQLVIAECLLYVEVPMHEEFSNTIAQLLLLLYIYAFGKYISKKNSGSLKKIGIKYLLFFAIILFVDTGIVLVLGDFIMNNMQTSKTSLLLFLYIGIVIGIVVQITLLINTIITRNVYKENEQLAKQFLENQKEHYLYLEKRELETKKFRHDIKNHLLILQNQIEKKDYDEAELYLAALNEKISIVTANITVNNSIADAILNKFYVEAKEKNIEIVVKGHFPLECHISAFDICTILSNLMSNAILAETQCGGKSISLDIRYTMNDVLFVIENDFNHELKIENGEIKTTKADDFMHGFGLSNVKECVERGGGQMVVSTDNNRFKVMISMKNELVESV